MESITLNWITTGILFGILQLIFLCSFLLLKNKIRNQGYLVLLCVVLLFTQLEVFFNRSGLTAQFPHVVNTTTPLIFLLGPIVYLYIRKWTRNSAGKWEQLGHMIPFILYFGYSFFFFLQPAAYKYNAFVGSFHPELAFKPVVRVFDADPMDIQGLVVVELLSLHILLYCIFCFYAIRPYLGKVKMRWPLFQTTVLFIGGVMLFISQGGVINGVRFLQTFLPEFSADLYGTLATYAISFYFLYYGVEEEMQLPKYYKSSLSKEIKNNRLNVVLNALETQRLYSHPEFSLKWLAQRCNMSSHHLSQILNEEMGCTFFELTNNYRIEEAKKRLSESENQYKIEQLAYELGYRSKTTFFTAFKKATNLTPQKFREIQSN